MEPSGALYVPYIHFRDEAWLKAAALFWPYIARIVPEGYTTKDTPTVVELCESQFVVNLDPGPAVEKASEPFIKLLEENGVKVLQHLTAGHQTRGRIGRGDVLTLDGVPLTYVHSAKVAPQLRQKLSLLKLALPPVAMWRMVRPRISFDQDHAKNWIGIDERLASVYICVLADILAQENMLAPTTDQPSAQIALGQHTVEWISGALLGDEFTASRSTPPPTPIDSSRIAFLALSMVAPRDLVNIPVRQILRFRERYSAELEGFRTAVAKVASSLSMLEGASPQILEAQLHHQVNYHLLQPRRDLQRALRAAHIETAEAILSMKLSVPAVLASAGATFDQPIATGLGAAMGVLTIAGQIHKRRQEQLAANPAAAYLLAVGKEMEPESAVRRALATTKSLAARHFDR